jgi:hypothetical protein
LDVEVKEKTGDEINMLLRTPPFNLNDTTFF